tara:strand:- start:94 stop:480 length:387 start_codon:yes stop_codon:yes gene_type:complete
MNINDLTLGQIKDLQNLLGGGSTTNRDIFSRYVGKYVICRTRNEGINAGKVLELDETGVILEDARRLYYHRPKNKKTSWYEGVAATGLSDDNKIGEPVEKILVEDYSLTICTSEAEKSIREAETNEQG